MGKGIFLRADVRGSSESKNKIIYRALDIFFCKQFLRNRIAQSRKNRGFHLEDNRRDSPL